MLLRVHVRPRSSRSAIVGVREGVLDVALSAPPVDGEANAELIKLIARTLGVRRAEVAIKSGQTGRQKHIAARGLALAEAISRVDEAIAKIR